MATRLKWIMILQVIFGGLLVLPLFGILGISICGLAMGKDWFTIQPGDRADHEVMKWLLFVTVIVWGMINLTSGYLIRKRQFCGLSIGIAVINTLLFPFGTLFGLPALIVLLNKRCKAVYADGDAH